MIFELHSTLARDTLPVASLALCELRLMNDARYPWCILVPRVPGIREWHHLSDPDQARLMAEVGQVSEVLEALPGITKLNVGALGNIVEQLHVHVLGRHPEDAAWPGPVWGQGSARPYVTGTADGLINLLRQKTGSGR